MNTVVDDIIRAAGSLAMNFFHKSASLTVEEKSKFGLVTQADKEVETFILKRLIAAFPDDGFFGEEGNAKTGKSGRIWVIDPIDGTFNFVRGSADWSISIGLYDNHKPIYGAIFAPVQGKLLTGGQDYPATLNAVPIKTHLTYQEDRCCVGIGISSLIKSTEKLNLLSHLFNDAEFVFRHNGSATISLMKVATGEWDAYIGYGDSSWDVMAAFAILEKLGHHTTIAWDNFNLEQKLKFACGKPELVTLLSSTIGKIS